MHPASPPFGFPAFACASEMLDVVRSSSAPTSMTCCSRRHNRRHWGELKDIVTDTAADIGELKDTVNGIKETLGELKDTVNGMKFIMMS